MSMLFENVTMDIQAERMCRAKAEERLDATQKAFEVYKQVSRMQRRGCPEAEIKRVLSEKFALTEEEAKAEYRKALEEYLKD